MAPMHQALFAQDQARDSLATRRARAGTLLALTESHMNAQTALPAQAATTEEPTHEQIAAEAYRLYLARGCQDGHATEDWQLAEQLLREKHHHAAAITHPAPEADPAWDTIHLDARHDVKHEPHHDNHNSTFARDERGSAGREEIRRQSSAMRPAARQSQRPNEHSAGHQKH